MEHGAGGHGTDRLNVLTERRTVRNAARIFEWGLLSVLIATLVLYLVHEGRAVQGQAELAAIKSMLGTLRTAAVHDDLRAKLRGVQREVSGRSRNPFELLTSPPANYLGNRVDASDARPGSWFFDPGCACVAYVPLDSRWLSTPSQAAMLRFRVSQTPGPLQLQAMEPYLWQSRPVD